MCLHYCYYDSGFYCIALSCLNPKTLCTAYDLSRSFVCSRMTPSLTACMSMQQNCIAECAGYCAAGKAPCDILLLFAASEGDAPKVIELLAAGANTDVKVSQLASFPATEGVVPAGLWLSGLLFLSTCCCSKLVCCGTA